MTYAPDWAYIPGRPHAICDRCGEKRRLDQLAKEWTNLMVCRDVCLDPRPPQLDPPNIWPEGTPVPNARPDPTPIFVEPGDITPEDL